MKKPRIDWERIFNAFPHWLVWCLLGQSAFAFGAHGFVMADKGRHLDAASFTLLSVLVLVWAKLSYRQLERVWEARRALAVSTTRVEEGEKRVKLAEQYRNILVSAGLVPPGQKKTEQSELN